ncbi:HAD hydrolase-like protein [Actinoplanes sp. URMC 104]|uniref:HAD hydrolase-like protein n=1 Tax=Actinoplanes sp. URMC 104 TaxID=3423409 RepID=UPI003F1CB65D
MNRTRRSCRQLRPSCDPKPADCTLIGDSLTDVGAAWAAGISVIGYADQAWK